MLETGLVTDNVVQGAAFGILLQQGPATSFGARVFRNDITGSATRAVGILGTYTLPTELSWDGVGNYWGHSTTPCFTSSDTPLPGLIQDSYPSCVPVAAPE
jgi:nitrous oxidase accessory protein NosD